VNVLTRLTDAALTITKHLRWRSAAHDWAA